MTIQVQEIPLNAASQTLNIGILGVNYTFNIIWRGTGYIMDILTASGTPLVQGISLVTGLDLLEQYTYLGLPFELVMLSDGIPNQVPTYTNLGISTHLCVVTNV